VGPRASVNDMEKRRILDPAGTQSDLSPSLWSVVILPPLDFAVGKLNLSFFEL
jgi:hypothetical protein